MFVSEPELGVGLNWTRRGDKGAGCVLNRHVRDCRRLAFDQRSLVEDLDDRLFLLLLGIAAAEEGFLWGLGGHQQDI